MPLGDMSFLQFVFVCDDRLVSWPSTKHVDLV